MIVLNEDYRPNTLIRKEDKISLAKLKREINTYPVNTYLRFAVKGNINDINQYTYGKLKTPDGKWTAYGSLTGLSPDSKKSDDEILKFIMNKGIKNIGVKLPK